MGGGRRTQMKRARFLPLVEAPLLEPYEEEPAAIPQPDPATIRVISSMHPWKIRRQRRR